MAPMNVLSIFLDDWRPSGSAFNESWLRTPNIQSVAERGTTFSRAYVQAPQCGPTRNSFLTGLRPDHTRVFTNGDLKPGTGVPASAVRTYFRQAMPDGATVKTLPQYFREHGYYTSGAGKVFHPGTGFGPGDSGEEGISWSTPYYYCMMNWNGSWYHNRTLPGCNMSQNCVECLEKAGTMVPTRFGNSWSEAECPDECYADANVAAEVGRQLRQRNSSTTPWFISFGLHLPHLPFYAPKKYYDQVDELAQKSSLVRKIASKRDPPTHPSGYDPYDNFEFLLMNDLSPVMKRDSNGYDLVPDDFHYPLRRGYWAAVLFCDANIGRVLDVLRETGQQDNTIISMVGDHGYGLGELGGWGKYSLLEQATRAPMIISTPRHHRGAAHTTAEIVEFIDLFPTLAEAAGLPSPPGIDGVSRMNLLKEGIAGMGANRGRASAKGAMRAFSQYPAVHRPSHNNGSVMGCAMRQGSWRLVSWCAYNFTSFRPSFDSCVAHELYSYEVIIPNDEDLFDWSNVAADPTHASTLQQLRADMTSNWG